MKSRMLILGLIVVWLSFMGAMEGRLESSQCVVSGVRMECCAQCSANDCIAQGCCWAPVTGSLTGGQDGIPSCFQANPAKSVYSVAWKSQNETAAVAQLKAVRPWTQLGPDVPSPQLTVWAEAAGLLRLRVYDPQRPRWEVPTIARDLSKRVPFSSAGFEVSVTGDEESGSVPVGVAVTSLLDGVVLFNSTPGTDNPLFNALVFKDQLLELSTSLLADWTLYGLGERVYSLALTRETYYTLWARDEGTPVLKNLYGQHPFVLAVNSQGRAFGLFLLNSNAMDVYLGTESLTFRPTGGILDLFVIDGPAPKDVVQAYHRLIGTPYLPPYWALGFHQCRWGYHNISMTREVVAQYREHDIPLETMWNDIDYMQNYLDFTFDPERFPVNEMDEFVAELAANGQHYVVIVDPGIHNQSGYAPWDRGLEADVFIRNVSGQPSIGSVWPGTTAWPDFLHPNAQSYWSDLVAKFHATVPVSGLWVDMNEISNFCVGQCPNQNCLNVDTSSATTSAAYPQPANYSYPPYAVNNAGSRNQLACKTMNMTDLHYSNVLEYNAHGLYGMLEANATRAALEQVRGGRRALVISRSTYPGHGSHAGHWLGDNTSDWPDLYYSIPGMLAMQYFGIPLVGADICGFAGASNEELCARWMALGAFYPFSRNHNAIGEPSQEPYVWPSVAAVSRKVLRMRYELLPLYYTQFEEVSRLGGAVVQPVGYVFPNDPNTLRLDTQFMIADAIMVCPVLTQGALSVRCYLPAGEWVDLWTLNPSASMSGGGDWIHIEAQLDHIPLLIRGGTAFVKQEAANSLAEAYGNPMNIVAALDSSGQASGSLYRDDGDSLVQSSEPLRCSLSASIVQSALLVSCTGDSNYGAPLRSISLVSFTHWENVASVNCFIGNAPTPCSVVNGTSLVADQLLNSTVKMNASFKFSWSI